MSAAVAVPAEVVPGRRRWSVEDRAFRADGVVPVESPEVMDSWLVDAGRTRAPERHAARFVAACAAAGVSPARTSTFLAAARVTIPATGRWFPRVELVVAGDGARQLQCWLRPAPARGEVVRLRVHPGADERRRPQVKGPDQAFLSACRQAAVGCGADDAVLLAGDGTVGETSSAGLMWWRDGVLCTPPHSDTVLASVTVDLLVDAARAVGVEVVRERVPPAALDGLEVWAVNALHGIRPVIGWVDAAIIAGAATRAAGWNRRLDPLTVATPESETLSMPVRSR